MVSNAQRGAYYKSRTKKWLEAKGYQVADLEKVHWIFRENQPALATKKDQFASDLLAVSLRSVIFVQVKGGGAVTAGNFPDARRKFAQYQFPPWTRQWVIAWPARSRVPRIVDCGRRIDGKAINTSGQDTETLTFIPHFDITAAAIGSPARP